MKKVLDKIKDIFGNIKDMLILAKDKIFDIFERVHDILLSSWDIWIKKVVFGLLITSLIFNFTSAIITILTLATNDMKLYGATGSQGNQGIQGEPGAPGVPGINGINGAPGVDGQTPYIGANNNWWIDGVDTGLLVVVKMN